MSSIVVVENEHFTLWYYPDSKIVHHAFHQFTFGREFRECLNAGIDVLGEHGAQKWLSDDRNNSALPAEDAKWGQQDWTPRMLEAGWKYWAIVLPEKVIGQMNMKRFIEENAGLGLTMQAFTDPDEALKWLESQ